MTKERRASRGGKSDFRTIISMLARLIQQKQAVAADAIEYEYEEIQITEA